MDCSGCLLHPLCYRNKGILMDEYTMARLPARSQYISVIEAWLHSVICLNCSLTGPYTGRDSLGVYKPLPLYLCIRNTMWHSAHVKLKTKHVRCWVGNIIVLCQVHNMRTRLPHVCLDNVMPTWYLLLLYKGSKLNDRFTAHVDFVSMTY